MCPLFNNHRFNSNIVQSLILITFVFLKFFRIIIHNTMKYLYIRTILSLLLYSCTLFLTYAGNGARITTGGTVLYGYLDESNQFGRESGWYRFLSDNIELQWRSLLNSSDYDYSRFNAAWIKDDKICGYVDWMKYGVLWGQTYCEMNVANGDITAILQDADCIYEGGVFSCAAYVPEENAVYGYACNEYESEQQYTALFQKTSAYPFSYSVIKKIDRTNLGSKCLSICYNPVDKELYGITADMNFVKIDKITGNQTFMSHIDLPISQQASGMCYSSAENCFYWNPVFGEEESALVTIDIASGDVNEVMKFGNSADHFSLLSEMKPAISDAVPLPPIVKNIDFDNGNLSGNVTFSMPVKYTDNESITDDIVWHCYLDGEEYSSGLAHSGEDIAIGFEDLSIGEHLFSMYVEINGRKSDEIFQNYYVGFDEPCAPVNVVLKSDGVFWDDVVSGIHGGSIDAANKEYEVRLNNELVGSTSSNSFLLKIGQGRPLQKYQASVMTKCGGLTSDESFSNSIIAGDPWNIPVDISASQCMLELMTIVNSDNEETHTWNIDPYTDAQAFYSGRASISSGDDWLFLPAVNFAGADNSYSLSVDCKRISKVDYGMRLEVCYGLSPDPQSMEGNVILQSFLPQSGEFKQYSNPKFNLPNESVYYIGLHAVAAVGESGLLVSRIRVEATDAEDYAPSAVSNLKVMVGDKGTLNASVSFDLPEKTIAGESIDSNILLTAHVIVNDSAPIVLSGYPGEHLSESVVTIQGENKIKVIPILNDIAGVKTEVDVYTGVSIPGDVRNLTVDVSNDMMSARLSWSAPESINSSGYVDSESVDYYLHVYNGDEELMSRYIGTGITHYDFDLPPELSQGLYSLGIEARNVAGCTGHFACRDVVMGAPYGLPLCDDFDSGDFSQNPWISDDNHDVDWMIFPINEIRTDWNDIPGNALCGVVSSKQVAESCMSLPRFSTKGQSNVKLSMNAWTGNLSAATSVVVYDYDNYQPEIIGIFPYSESDDRNMWKILEFDLPSQFLGKDWVQISLLNRFDNLRKYVIIDELKIEGNYNSINKISTDNRFVVGCGDGLKISGYKDCYMVVYSVDGHLIYNANISSDESVIVLDSGFYIVRFADKVMKIAVY